MAGTNLGTAYVTIMPSAKGISGSISKTLDGEATSAGKSAGLNIVKAVTGVIAGAGITKAFKDALDAGGDLQQSFGGLDTIYEDASESMKNFAKEAAAAGISANSYAEQAVSFGASLKQAFGDDLNGAANAANTAILDMADNAAKMGTDIGSIQTAYQGFAKQNYTMLDNLKLGYGGTKAEMERLLKDAQALTGVEYNIDNLGDVYAAIHAIQVELGLSGVAADEAKTTLSGSAGAVKAAFENLRADMALGNDIKDDMSVLAESTSTFLTQNLLPMIGNVLKSLPTLIGEWLKTGFENMPSMVDSAIQFIQGLADGIATQSGPFFEGINSLMTAASEAIKSTDWIGLGSSILSLLWEGMQALGSWLWDNVKSLASTASEKFKEIDWAAVGQSVVTAIGNAIGSVGRWLFDKFAELGSTAGEEFENVDWAATGQNAFHMLVEGIGNVAESLWEGLKTIGTTAAEHFKDIDWHQVGQNVITTISNGIAAVGGFLFEGITTIATSASEFFRNIDWEQAGKDAVTTIANGLTSIGTFLWDAITTIATTAKDKLSEIDWKQAGIDILTAIKDGLVSIGSFLWGALQEIGSMAKDKILEISWVQTGIDVVNGVIDGIKQFGENIADTLVGFAKNAWTKIKDFFSIGSPSKLMRDTVGKWIPLGIAEGIEDEAGAVTDAMQDIAMDASGVNITPTISGSPLAALTNGLGGVVMNITVNGAESPEDWAERLGRQLKMELRAV